MMYRIGKDWLHWGLEGFGHRCHFGLNRYRGFKSRWTPQYSRYGDMPCIRVFSWWRFFIHWMW